MEITSLTAAENLDNISLRSEGQDTISDLQEQYRRKHNERRPSAISTMSSFPTNGNRSINNDAIRKFRAMALLQMAANAANHPDVPDAAKSTANEEDEREKFYAKYNINLIHLLIKPYMIGSAIICILAIAILIAVFSRAKIFFEWKEEKNRIAHILILSISILLFLSSLVIFSIFTHAKISKKRDTIATTFVHNAIQSLYGTLTSADEQEIEEEEEEEEELDESSVNRASTQSLMSRESIGHDNEGDKDEPNDEKKKISKQIIDIFSGSVLGLAIIMIISLFHQYQYTNERYSLFIGSIMPCLLIGILSFILIYSILYEFMEEHYEAKANDVLTNNNKNIDNIHFIKKKVGTRGDARNGLRKYSKCQPTDLMNVSPSTSRRTLNLPNDNQIMKCLLKAIYVNRKKYEMFRSSAIVSSIFVVISSAITSLFFAFYPVGNLVESKNYAIQSVLGALSIICGLSIANLIISIGRFMTIAINLNLDCDTYTLMIPQSQSQSPILGNSSNNSSSNLSHEMGGGEMTGSNHGDHPPTGRQTEATYAPATGKTTVSLHQ